MLSSQHSDLLWGELAFIDFCVFEVGSTEVVSSEIDFDEPVILNAGPTPPSVLEKIGSWDKDSRREIYRRVALERCTKG